MRGDESSARPIATRWRSPPDSSRGPAPLERAETEHVDHSLPRERRAARCACARRQPACIIEVALDGQVREQPPVLEYPADAAALHRHRDAATRVREHVAVENDAAAIRRNLSGDQRERGRLSAARGPEQRCDAGSAHLELAASSTNRRRVALHSRTRATERLSERAAQRRARRPSISAAHSAETATTSDERRESAEPHARRPAVCSAL
jgi:hypothetical protein